MRAVRSPATVVALMNAPAATTFATMSSTVTPAADRKFTTPSDGPVTSSSRGDSVISSAASSARSRLRSRAARISPRPNVFTVSQTLSARNGRESSTPRSAKLTPP